MAPPNSRTKQLSIVDMISMTVFLIFMDVKDLYYKIFMVGAYPSFSFVLQMSETVTDYDMVEAIREANGTWLSRLDAFMWATGMPGDIVDEPLATPPDSSGLYATYFNLNERDYRQALAAMVSKNKADIPVIKAD
ncbi:unnamed protein product, partial [Aphanomyces euteiches]